MSDLTDVPRKRRIRARYLVLAGVVILLTLGMAALSLRNDTQPSSYEAARAAYEHGAPTHARARLKSLRAPRDRDGCKRTASLP